MHANKTTEHNQLGAALLTALVFLVILTLLGIGVFTSTVSEETVARNFRDKEIALQAAEAALNEAHVLITGSFDNNPMPPSARRSLSEDSCHINTPTGYSCDQTINASTLNLYSGSGLGAPVGTLGLSDSPDISGLYAAPRYLVIWRKPGECANSNVGSCFQIVAQAKGRLANTRVNLVEMYAF